MNIHARMKEIDDQFNILIRTLDGEMKTFKTEESFIEFMQAIFKENEHEEPFLKSPQNYTDALSYLNEYCDNLTLITAN